MKTITAAALAAVLATGCGSEDTGGGGERAMEIARRVDSTFVTEEGCTVEQFRLHSPSMGRDIRVAVVLPPAYAADSLRHFPVLYTLHGARAPYDTWANMPRLRRQLAEMPFIYTCFDGDGYSMYIDAARSVPTGRGEEGVEDTVLAKSLFTTFFFDEFVPGIDAWYRTDPSRRGVTGFSMGGFGALHYMLTRPEMFGSVSSLSGAFVRTGDATERMRVRAEQLLGPVDGTPQAYGVFDLYARLSAAVEGGETMPPVYLHCGRDDFLVEQNRDMYGHLQMLKVPVEYLETEGAHNWAFWHPASVGVAEFHWKYFSR